MKDNILIGQEGENEAAKYLEEHDYKIITRNLRLKNGEIDILAQKDDVLILVEVKAGRTGRYGLAAERISAKKRAKLRALAKNLVRRYPNKQIRLDALNVDDRGQILHFENILDC
ncbi:YraN family protein [Candidatus Berkelbacteria bacterium]|nr:YraN family protein [Candidatus Berkelbacteria bacterium]